VQLTDAYNVLGIRQWATEPEVRAAWSARQQDPQVYQAAEMIRMAGFPAGPQNAPPQQGYVSTNGYPVPPQQPQGGPQYPFPQQQQQPQYAQQPNAQYPFPLAPQQQMAPPPVQLHESKRGGTQILVGAGLLILGIVITSATHSAAVHNGGGSYVVAYGPIVVGVITIFKGIFNLAAGR
jgi:hypothetical protein